MLKLLVVLPIKNKNRPPFSHRRRLVFLVPLGPLRRYNCPQPVIEARPCEKVKKHVVTFQLPSWLFQVAKSLLKKLRGGGGVYLILSCITVSCVKYPWFKTMISIMMFILIYIYIYILYIYPDVPMNCDDLAEVKDMPCHFHQKWLVILGRVFYNQNAGCSMVFAVAALVCV